MDTRFSDHIKSLENAKIPDDAIVKMLAKKGVIVTVEDVKAARNELVAAVGPAVDLAKDPPADPAQVVEKVAEVVAAGAASVAVVAAAVGAEPVAAGAGVVAAVAKVVETAANALDGGDDKSLAEHFDDSVDEAMQGLLAKISAAFRSLTEHPPEHRNREAHRLLRGMSAVLTGEAANTDDGGSPAVVRAITKARVTGPDGKPMLIQFRGVYRDDLAKWLWANHRSRVEPFPPRS